MVVRWLCSKILLAGRCPHGTVGVTLCCGLMNPIFPCKRYWRSAKMQHSVSSGQYFDYFLVLDFEATCEEGRQIELQEIIEFPVIKVHGGCMRNSSVFHRYVRPTQRPSPFCIQLTGITEEMLINQPSFKDVMLDFENWMIHENLLNKKVAFVTCGNWDLQVMLPNQCNQIKYPVPSVMKSWINIKKAFSEATGTFPKSLMHMLELLNIKHHGRLHSGIDDCYNVCQIMAELAHRGYVFKLTNSYIPFEER